MEGKAAIAAMLEATLAADEALGMAGRPALRDRGRNRFRPGSPSRPQRARAAASSRSKTASAAPSSPRCSRSTATRKRPGRARPMGVRHGADRNRKTWSEDAGQRGSRLRRRHRAALLPDHRRRPGRHHARRAAEATRRADGHRREERQGRRFLAQPLPLARAARPGLVRSPALHALSRRTGPSSRPRTRWATGSRCTSR